MYVRMKNSVKNVQGEDFEQNDVLQFITRYSGTYLHCVAGSNVGSEVHANQLNQDDYEHWLPMSVSEFLKMMLSKLRDSSYSYLKTTESIGWMVAHMNDYFELPGMAVVDDQITTIFEEAGFKLEDSLTGLQLLTLFDGTQAEINTMAAAGVEFNKDFDFKSLIE